MADDHIEASHLDELVLRWQQSQRDGDTRSLNEFCGNDQNLIKALKTRLSVWTGEDGLGATMDWTGEAGRH